MGRVLLGREVRSNVKDEEGEDVMVVVVVVVESWV